MDVTLFVMGSAAIAYVSRHALRAPGSHGFFRFFAWECLLALFLLNWRSWFKDPLSLPQVMSWVLLTVSTVLVLHGVHLLHRLGKPGAARSGDVTLLGVEKTTVLVTVGAFKYIRHPLYCSLLCLSWAVFFKSPSRLGAVLALAATTFLVATAKVEEAECVRFFGSAYQAYMTRTKMFVPFLL